MDPHRFDRLSQALGRSTTRRAAVAAVLGGLLQEVGVAVGHRRRKRRKRQAEAAQERSLLPLEPSGPTLPIVPSGPTAPGLPPERRCRLFCPGCCTRQGVCHPGTSAAVCGAGGATCAVCANPTPVCRDGACAACTSHAECAAAGQGSLCCDGACLSGVCCQDAECLPAGNHCARHACLCGASAPCAGDTPDCCGAPGTCTSTDTDPGNCGACGHVCSGARPACFHGACTCHVCASGCPFSTVQAAIDASQPGETIRLCAGRYTENVVIPDGKEVTLIGDGDGENPALDTILDGGGAGSVLVIHTATVALQGLRLSGGSAEYGGGLYNGDGTVTMRDCTVTGNSASYGGGGIYNYETLTLTNSRVTGNQASEAGGGILNQITLTLADSDVAGNHSNANGGGIFNQGFLTLTGSRVRENTAGDEGGGIWNDYEATVNASSVTGNTAARRGGGIWTSDTLTLNRSGVSQNTAWYGGGLYGRYTVRLNHSSVSENTATLYAGGIQNLYGTLTLDASDVTRNAAGIGGGGIDNSSASDLYLVNGSTVTANTAAGTPPGGGGSGGGILNSGRVDASGGVIAGNTPDNCVNRSYPGGSGTGCP